MDITKQVTVKSKGFVYRPDIHKSRFYPFPWKGRCILMPAAVDPILDLCTRFRLQLSGQRQCRTQSLLQCLNTYTMCYQVIACHKIVQSIQNTTCRSADSFSSQLEAPIQGSVTLFWYLSVKSYKTKKLVVIGSALFLWPATMSCVTCTSHLIACEPILCPLL